MSAPARMKWSRRACASADPSVGSVPAPSSSSRTSVPGPAASTILVIERRWPENVDRLWATDCSSPISAKTSLEHRQPRAGLGRHVQPGLVHEREQAERPQRHGLAARVRSGHHERRIAVAEPDVDGHDPPRQARMAGPEQDDLGPVGRLRPGAVHTRPRAAPWRPRSRTGRARRASRAAAPRWPRRAPTARRGSARSPPARRPGPRARRCRARRRRAARRTGSGRCPTRRGRCP